MAETESVAPPPAQVFGQLKAFDPERENISTYLERVELYFDVNGVVDDKRVPVLLTVIGPSVYATVRSLVAPDKPRTKTYKQLEEVLRSHFEPKPLVIAERSKFYRRTQNATETVLEYAAELRRLAITCDFGTFLDTALRDKFVFGLRSEPMRKSLLTEDGITMAKAVELAQAKEAAARDVKDYKEASATAIGHVSRSTSRRPASTTTSCTRCGKTNHSQQQCRFRKAKCHSCWKTGHIAKMCRSKPANREVKQVQVGVQQSSSPDSDLGEYSILSNSRSKSSPPITVEVNMSGQLVTMELDTGAAATVMSNTTFRKLFPNMKTHRSPLILNTYSGHVLRVLGEVTVDVVYRDQPVKSLSLIIVDGDGPTLLGRDWLKFIKLDWKTISAVSREASVRTLLDKYKDVFAPGLGTIHPFRASLSITPDARPRFLKARPVPYSQRAEVEAELERLESQGVLEKVTYSEWATPVVVVPKKDGRTRLCGDYKVTVNPVLEVDQYPLPKPNDLFASLSGGACYSKLDLKHAYNQMELDEQSQKLATINTHRGLYRYRRLPFGIASAPAIFQKAMDVILQGMNHVICYIDDILITGANLEEHLANLEEVLKRLQEHGVRLREDKCQFLTPSVEYLGHVIGNDGLRTADDKLRAIVDAPSPTNVQELRSFLGLLNYYGKFIANLSTLIRPLNKLLCTKTPWSWSNECQESFQRAKEALVSSKVLVHYNPLLPLKLAGDASAYGVGAVISHVMEDGSERPIAYASRTLSPSERNYAQVEKEALSLVFGVKKFHAYLYGRKFTLVTDHKPLTTILGPKNKVPPLAAARLQRWALVLSAYSYEIEFRPTAAHGNADGLSRLPLHEPSSEDAVPSGVTLFNVSQLDSLPVTSQQLQAATRTDPVLSRILRCTREGWPKQPDDQLRPYWSHRHEFTIEQECLLWGIRALIPKKLQSQLLAELHRDHTGISRMKAVARGYFWWPGLDQEIADMVAECQTCLAVKHSPTTSILHPWEWPPRPWQRVHIDFAGPFQGANFLVAVDAHSKWPEVEVMGSTTAAKTIEVLRRMFATNGLPEHIVTDNGPQFISEEFAQFLKENGIKHTRSAPYHPASNGLAERFVQSLKTALKTSVSSGLSLAHRLSSFLLTYRSSPHATTGVSPCSLFIHRPLRTRLDLLRPNQESRVTDKQSRQKDTHDKKAKFREFHVGQSVMARNVRPGDDWIPATVVERTGPVSYLVETCEHQLWKRHVDQLKTLADSTPVEGRNTASSDSSEDFDIRIPTTTTAPVALSDDSDVPRPPEPEPPNAPPPRSADPPADRYPRRPRTAPEYYGFRNGEDSN